MTNVEATSNAAAINPGTIDPGTIDAGTVDIVRARDRFVTELDWLDSKHSFSFGPHYDPANTGHGLLIVNNDDIVSAGTGFGMHPHRDMEIVTWVLSGELEHRDSEGNHGVIYPGLAQKMSAGTGIYHSEHNPSSTTPVHFFQMWVRPDTTGLTPSYAQADVSDDLSSGKLIAVASGQGHDGAIPIHQRDAVLWAGRLAPGSTVTVPPAGHTHVQIATGSARVAGRDLGAGDAARLIALDSTANDEHPVTIEVGTEPVEVLIWTTS